MDDREEEVGKSTGGEEEVVNITGASKRLGYVEQELIRKDEEGHYGKEGGL